jgi:hypothetical protein
MGYAGITKRKSSFDPYFQGLVHNNDGRNDKYNVP